VNYSFKSLHLNQKLFDPSLIEAIHHPLLHFDSPLLNWYNGWACGTN